VIFRTLFFIFVFIPLLIVGIPVQFVITRLGLFNAFLTMLFHRVGCIFLGLRVRTIGHPLDNHPTLLLCNHISWTDIIAIGSVADVTFVSKQSMKKARFVAFMSSLQRTLYVDYDRRTDTRRTSREMAKRLASNGAVLLFAEGHRDLGTHVQPFRSALVGAAQQAMAEGGARDVMIQPVCIAYTHLQGLPVSRTERSGISGMNARGFKQVVGNLLTSGVKDVTVAFGTPIPMTAVTDRKVVTKQAETEVRRMLVKLNRHEDVSDLLSRATTAPVPAA
jgi:lyso-ornithine lipid O-acyltransferase